MSNFFFINNSEIQTQESHEESHFVPICLDPDESRTFHQGKSFRFWNWNDNKGRTFINDDFYQDLVRYDNSIWICINTTTSIPGTSNDWTEFIIDGEKGTPGDTPQLKIEGEYWYASYDSGNTWTNIGMVIGSKADLEWGEY